MQEEINDLHHHEVKLPFLRDQKPINWVSNTSQNGCALEGVEGPFKGIGFQSILGLLNKIIRQIPLKSVFLKCAPGDWWVGGAEQLTWELGGQNNGNEVKVCCDVWELVQKF